MIQTVMSGPTFFYAQERPKPGDIVVATVTSVGDVAVYGLLPAYGFLEVMLPTSEIYVAKRRKVGDYVHVGQTVVVEVIRCSATGLVDVSLKKVAEREREEVLTRFHRDQKVNLIVRSAAAAATRGNSVVTADPAAVATLYRDVVWPLGEDPYTVFEEVRAGGAMAETLPPALVTAIHQKMPEASYTASEEVMLRFGPYHDGVARLNAALQRLSALESIQVVVVGAPKFRLTATDKTPARAAARLAAAISQVPVPC
jgi:translation initiation factor 2 subunit 1